MLILIPACVLVVGVLGTYLVQRKLHRERWAWERRVRDLGRQVAGFDATSQPGEKPDLPPLPTVERWLGETRLFQLINKKLILAGVNLSSQEFFAVVVITAAALLALGALATQSVFLSLSGAGVGAFAPFGILGFLRNRRKSMLEKQLADALILVSTSLQAGYGFLQGLRVASEQLPSPISEEFERVAFNVSIGMSLPLALQGLGQRVQSYEYDLVISAVTTQIESGGSITGLLETIAETIRGRIALRDEIRATTAQGKLSGIVLSLLPVGLLVGLSFINPMYANLLFKNPLGHTILKMAGGMLLMGWLVVRKILAVRF